MVLAQPFDVADMRMTYVTLHISCFWEHTLANSNGYLSLHGRSYGAFLSTVAREAKRVCRHLVLMDKGQECVEWDSRTSERPTTSIPNLRHQTERFLNSFSFSHVSIWQSTWM